MKALDLTGQRFGRLVALRQVQSRARHAMWLCRCDCGKEIVTRGTGLRYGSSKSCGCARRERLHEAITTHGLSGGRAATTRLYRIWRNMKQRCYNPKAAKFDLYGGRGVGVCQAWQGFEAFHAWAIAAGYRDDLTLDRIDPDGNYEPSNCRWATYREQALHTSQTHFLTFRGETLPLSTWANRIGIEPSTLSSRINDYGWPIEKALTTPLQRRAS